jgi:hypothetical protein
LLIKQYKLKFLKTELAICKLHSDNPIPDWVSENGLFAVIRTPKELTLICENRNVPVGILKESGWWAIYLDEDLDFDLTGVLATILEPLAESGVSVFSLSTYSTDYILFRKDKLAVVKQALINKGFSITDTT